MRKASHVPIVARLHTVSGRRRHGSALSESQPEFCRAHGVSAVHTAWRVICSFRRPGNRRLRTSTSFPYKCTNGVPTRAMRRRQPSPPRGPLFHQIGVT